VAPTLRLIRAPNLIIAAAGVFAGGWIALRDIAVPKELVFAALSGMALGAVGNTWNDIRDVAADRINRPATRPMAAGTVGRGTADFILFAGTLLGLAFAGLIGGGQVLAALAALAVMFSYSPLLKPVPLVGNLAVAIAAGSPPFYGALAAGGGRPAAGLVPWILAAWLHFVREIVKDVEDEAGDRAIDRRTLPIAVGRRPAMVCAASVALLFVPASLLLPLNDHYAGAYFLFALPAQMAVLVAATWLLLGKMARVSTLLKGAMVIGLVALVMGKAA
jgi:geranylgeranylglycerol-phosphate geranylgeranyltransferase